MEYYVDDGYLPPVSPPLRAIQPILKPDTLPDLQSDDETDIDEIIDLDTSWNRALRERKRPRPEDASTRSSQRKRPDRSRPSWKDGILVHEMGSRRDWEPARVAARSFLGPPWGDDSSDDEALESASRAPSNPVPRSRQRRARKRFALPLYIGNGLIPLKVMACPDSGSDDNILSMELANQLGLEVEERSDEPRRFSLANGKIVNAIGRVITRCSFASGFALADLDMECTSHVFSALAVPAIMGMEFLHQTETLTKYTDRLVEELVPNMQALRVNSIDRPRRSIICRLDNFVGCATVDTGSDLDLISPQFARSRAYTIEPADEQLEFADGSVGYTSGVISTSFSVGDMTPVGFHARGQAIDLELFILDGLNADILVGQDTVTELDIFNTRVDSFIPSIPRLGESDVNIIRHIGKLERGASRLWGKLKESVGGSSSDTSDATVKPDAASNIEAQLHLDDQRENARRERERARISKLSGQNKEREQALEDEAIRAFENERQTRLDSTTKSASASGDHSLPSSASSPNTSHCLQALPSIRSILSGGLPSIRSTSPPIDNHRLLSPVNHYSRMPQPPEAWSPSASPGSPTSSQTLPGPDISITSRSLDPQYLLNSHANVHPTSRPHYCPVRGCPRSEAGKGFKRKNDMIRHGLLHYSPDYICPFCPDREHKYQRPDSLVRHVRVHHVDKAQDDPVFLDVLRQQPDGPNREKPELIEMNQ